MYTLYTYIYMEVFWQSKYRPRVSGHMREKR